MIVRTDVENRVINAALIWVARLEERPYEGAPMARGLFDAVQAADEPKILLFARKYAKRQRQRPDPLQFGQHETELYDAAMALEAGQ